MPRAARRCPGGLVYHVLNRGNDRRAIFHKRGDALAFMRLLGEAKRRVPVRLLGWCLMSNHWHLVLWPREDGDLSAFMAWLSNAHVRRYRQHYRNNGDGHVYQGRFKSFVVGPQDLHFLTLLRYVEGNALRAGLVGRAEDWPWSSLRHWLQSKGLRSTGAGAISAAGAGAGTAAAGGDAQVPDESVSGNGDGPSALLDEWPVERPDDWVRIVNEPLRETELAAVRTSVARGRPLGAEDWVKRMAAALGVDFSLRGRGRPRKKGDIQNIPGSPSPAHDPEDLAADSPG